MKIRVSKFCDAVLNDFECRVTAVVLLHAEYMQANTGPSAKRPDGTLMETLPMTSVTDKNRREKFNFLIATRLFSRS